ncbi:hypothetical protein Efla_007829 [Eimeria flavescens]
MRKGAAGAPCSLNGQPDVSVLEGVLGLLQRGKKGAAAGSVEADGLWLTSSDEEEENSLSDPQAAYSNAVQELLLHLEEATSRPPPPSRREAAERGAHPFPLSKHRGLQRVLGKTEKRLTRLGAADRFAVDVSLFSLSILLFILVAKTSRLMRKKLQALWARRKGLGPFPPAAAAASGAANPPLGLPFVNGSSDGGAPSLSGGGAGKGGGPPDSSSLRGSTDEELVFPAAAAGPPPPGSRGPPPPSDAEGAPEGESKGAPKKGRGHLSRASPAAWKRRALKQRKGGPPPARLLAMSPALMKEEKKLRALEEMLFFMELDRFPNPGPEEFVLGVLSRVLDVQHIGSHSDV